MIYKETRILYQNIFFLYFCKTMATIENGKLNQNVMATNGIQSSGNTKPRFEVRGKNFMMTIQKSQFSIQSEIIDYLQHFKTFNYMLICEHDGPSDVHRHLYVQFSNSTRLNTMKLYYVHIEKALGSAQACIKYLRAQDEKHKKNGVNSTDIYENGVAAERGGCRIGDIKEMTDEELNNLSIQYYNTAKRIRPPPKIKANEWYKKIKVYYIFGDSGIGKTLSIYRILGLNKEEEFDEIKHSGNFWLGVSGEEVNGVVVYDDFRDSDMKPSEFVNFIDYHVHNLDYKGGSAKNKYHLIIITSVQSPYNIYKNVKGEPRKQWIRRMKIINLNIYNQKTLDANENQGVLYDLVQCSDRNNVDMV